MIVWYGMTIPTHDIKHLDVEENSPLLTNGHGQIVELHVHLVVVVDQVLEKLHVLLKYRRTHDKKNTLELISRKAIFQSSGVT